MVYINRGYARLKIIKLLLYRMPTLFLADQSVSNSIVCTYCKNLNNLKKSSNVLVDVLTPYDTIALRNASLTSYTTTTAMNSAISSALTPYPN